MYLHTPTHSDTTQTDMTQMYKATYFFLIFLGETIVDILGNN